jgi:4-amino-4-deoxy-L-arabinose transferase-like glycosyltransferase
MVTPQSRRTFSFLLPLWVRTAAVILLLALPLLGRFADLEADPPLNVAFIHAFATDEGYYSAHARAVTLFGEAVEPAYWDSHRVTPLYDLILQAAFRLLGVSFVTLRLPQVLLGIATVALLYLVLRREAGPAAARWAALFLAWSHIFIVFNRVGMYHTLLTTLCTAGALAWLRAWRRPAWFLLCGLAAACILLTSLFGVLFFGGLVLATVAVLAWGRVRTAAPNAARAPRTFQQHAPLLPQVQLRRAHLFFALGGVLLAVLPVIGLLVFPERGLVVRDLARSGALPLYTTPLQVVGNLFFFLYTPFFLLNLVPLSGMVLYTAQVVGRWRRERYVEPLAALLLGWFWSGTTVLAVVNYRPPRYFLYLLPALCAALALVITRWERYMDVGRRLAWWPAAALAIAGALLLLDRMGPQRYQGDVLWWIGVALSGGTAMTASLFLRAPPSRTALARIAPLLGIVCLLANGLWGLEAWVKRAHTLPEVSRELGQILPPEALLLHGCTLSIANQLHCLPMIEPDEVVPVELSGSRLFYFTEEPDEALPGDPFWGSWPVLDTTPHLYEVAPGRRTLKGLKLGHY